MTRRTGAIRSSRRQSSTIPRKLHPGTQESDPARDFPPSLTVGHVGCVRNDAEWAMPRVEWHSQDDNRERSTGLASMLLICGVLVALGAGLFFFPDTALARADRLTALLPGHLGLGSAVAWLVKHPWRSLIVFAIGVFILARRLESTTGEQVKGHHLRHAGRQWLQTCRRNRPGRCRRTGQHAAGDRGCRRRARVGCIEDIGNAAPTCRTRLQSDDMHALWLIAALMGLAAPVWQQADSADCTPWQTCRQLALDAAERGEFETFHTVAWRTVQTGPRNDPK